MRSLPYYLLLFFILNVHVNGQAQHVKGFHIVFHALNGHVLNESDIKYFDWTRKEIILKKGSCIFCLYKTDWTKLTKDIHDSIPHFTVYIDTVKIFDGYFPGEYGEYPAAPLIYIDRYKGIEMVRDGMVRFWTSKSIEEIYASLVVADSVTKKTYNIDKNVSSLSIKNEFKRFDTLNDKRLYEYLKSRDLLRSFAEIHNLKGLYIVFHPLQDHILQESDIEYFDWEKKEIKLKKDSCISCLYKVDAARLHYDVEDQVPHFTIYIDGAIIFEGYFLIPYLAKYPGQPLILVSQPDIEIVEDGVIKFTGYNSGQEIKVLRILNDKRLHEYLKSKHLLKD